jgi:hypothetical protein
MSKNLTVTSQDINFCYPDWMAQTKFVPVAKKYMPCGPGFFAEFSVQPEFYGSELKNICAQVVRDPWADLQITNQILYQCVTEYLCKK